MSIRKNKFGAYTVYCDECPDFCDTIEVSPNDAWFEAKLSGWNRAFDPNTYSYLHYCPDCWEEKE